MSFFGFWVAARLVGRPGKEINEFEKGDFLNSLELNPIIDLAMLFRYNGG